MVRMITPGEWATSQAECLQAESFDVVAGRDGGLFPQNIPVEQQEALEVAMYVCQARYPTDPTFGQPLTYAEWEYYYRYLNEVLTPCLRDRGIDVAEPPSFETFVDQPLPNGRWNPYDNVSSSTADLTRINEECPQKPPGLRE